MSGGENVSRQHVHVSTTRFWHSDGLSCEFVLRDARANKIRQQPFRRRYRIEAPADAEPSGSPESCRKTPRASRIVRWDGTTTRRQQDQSQVQSSSRCAETEGYGVVSCRFLRVTQCLLRTGNGGCCGSQNGRKDAPTTGATREVPRFLLLPVSALSLQSASRPSQSRDDERRQSAIQSGSSRQAPSLCHPLQSYCL